MSFGHRVVTGYNELQIIVPDDLLETASNILQEGRYTPVPHGEQYLEYPQHPREGTSPFPLAINLWHRDIPNDDPYRLEPIPDFILLFPQSYFGLDVNSTERFQFLDAGVAELDPLNARILVPKYHTFLEGLVHFVVDPPLGLEEPHRKGRVESDQFLNRLLTTRMKDDVYAADSVFVTRRRREILEELQTEDAR
ncbi:hypothetical protein H0H92_008758 [Tricholoma furcatifolium]|nr:hypothetical protein H0H92_008758 [Tricholoma furcatifolium]